MTKTPRNLRVLRIDDDLNALGRSSGGPQYASERAPDHLDTVEVSERGAKVPGIRSWLGAIEFWKQYRHSTTIDLILADVRFLDASSPLNQLAEAGTISLPTGLSHFRPFAAIARAQARPLGLGLHTREPDIWKNYRSAREPSLQFVSLLAAQEIGEIAAMMEADKVTADLTVEGCWKWLEDQTIKTENADDYWKAIPRALRQFRARLVDVKLLPKDFDALMKWCGHMSGGPEAGSALRLTDDEDRGFPIFTSDGRRDPVSIRSLFADVPLLKWGFEFDGEPLPAACYELVEDKNCYELDKDNNPKIGALIYACGSLARAYEEALKILDHFPYEGKENEPPKLATIKDTLRSSEAAGALAVFLQDVNRQFAIHRQWARAYREAKWNARYDRYDSDTNFRTLQQWLETIYKATPDDDFIDRDVVIGMVEGSDDSSDDDARFPGVTRCFRLLRDMESLLYEPRLGAYKKGPKAFAKSRVPPFPGIPPENFFARSDLGPAYTSDGAALDDPSCTLRQLLGHPRNGDAVLARQIFQGLGIPLDEATSFLDAFREGRAPAWLKELCRDYARDELHWTDTETWPAALRD